MTMNIFFIYIGIILYKSRNKINFDKFEFLKIPEPVNKFWLNTSIIAVFCAVAFYLYVKFRVAPDIDFEKLNLTNLEGKNIKFSELRNKATFISFSTSWWMCAPRKWS